MHPTEMPRNGWGGIPPPLRPLFTACGLVSPGPGAVWPATCEDARGAGQARGVRAPPRGVPLEQPARWPLQAGGRRLPVAPGEGRGHPTLQSRQQHPQQESHGVGLIKIIEEMEDHSERTTKAEHRQNWCKGCSRRCMCGWCKDNRGNNGHIKRAKNQDSTGELPRV